VELLKEATPRIARVGFLHEERGAGATYLRDLETATRALGLTLQDLRVREVNEIEGTLGAMSKEQGGSLIVPGDLLLMRHASQITQLATKYNLPGIYGTRVFMDAGGLMFYGPSLADLWRRAATYVDKILKGAKPADLPVEQPTKFELVINLKTAKALGLTIPQSLLLRADQVIE
jgi:putative tryptophan/tyrosine transport system substrate-binding protein